MADREDLQTIFEGILPEGEVHFQPKTNTRIDYSKGVIVYKRDWALTRFAANWPYRHVKRYQVTYIARNPDSAIYDAIAALQMCVFDRFYTENDLNHDVFKLFF
jgi:hypothetical protein